jgi:hypothetical protein
MADLVAEFPQFRGEFAQAFASPTFSTGAADERFSSILR